MYSAQQNQVKLQKIFDEIDVFFSNGEMYCRRLLCNYYGSRVLLHSKQNNMDQAIYYGKLSVRQENEDTLMYVNNLVSMYLRSNQIQKAKFLQEDFQKYYEDSHNSYRKISFISYQLRILTAQKQYQKAENIALYFLSKFEDEILQYRWHHFFTSYVHILLHSEKYPEILNLEKNFSLIKKEEERKSKFDYIPNLSWSIALASYMENKISKENLIKSISTTISDTKVTPSNTVFLKNTYQILSKNLPELSMVFKPYLK